MSMLMFAEKTQVESREALESDSPPASAPQGLGFEDTLPDEHPPWLERIGRLARNELLEISKDLVKLRQQPQRRWFISGAFARWRHFILEMRQHDVALCTSTTVKYLMAQVHKNTKKDYYFLARRVKVLRAMREELEAEYLRARRALEKQPLDAGKSDQEGKLAKPFIYHEVERKLAFKDLGEAQEPTAQLHVKRFKTLADLDKHMRGLAEQVEHLDDHIHLSEAKFKRKLEDQSQELELLHDMARGLEEMVGQPGPMMAL